MFLNFKYDLDKDIENHKKVFGAVHKGGPSKMLELYEKKFGPGLNEENLFQFIKEYLTENSTGLNQCLVDFKKEWELVETEFLQRANKIFNCEFPINNITAYLTTNDRCTCNIAENYFFLTVLDKRPKLVIMHELFHFYTFSVFGSELAGFDSKMAYDIKESLAEILNLEFSDLMETADRGYSQHKEMRELVRENWLSNEDVKSVFDALVDYCEYEGFIESAKEFASRKFSEIGKNNHFLDVFMVLNDEFNILDQDILVAGLLHDILEDTSTTYEEIEKSFSKKVADLVQEVSHAKYCTQEQKKEYYEKIKTISNNAKLIKMADFASNLRYFIGIYKKGEQHLYPKFADNDKYIKSIRDFLDSCEESIGKKVVCGLAKGLEALFGQ